MTTYCYARHSEERSDEESPYLSLFPREKARSLAQNGRFTGASITSHRLGAYGRLTSA